jgi:hypothetical protein
MRYEHDMIMNATELCDDMLCMVSNSVILDRRANEYMKNYDRD